MQTLECQAPTPGIFPESSGEPWEGFEQGSDIVNFAF